MATDRQVSFKLLLIKVEEFKSKLLEEGIDKDTALALSGRANLFEKTYPLIFDMMIHDLDRFLSKLREKCNI